MKEEALKPTSTTKQNGIPVVEIIDDCGYISQTKVIADIHVKRPNGEIIKKGKFSKTKKGGYMYG